MKAFAEEYHEFHRGGPMVGEFERSALWVLATRLGVVPPKEGRHFVEEWGGGGGGVGHILSPEELIASAGEVLGTDCNAKWVTQAQGGDRGEEGVRIRGERIKGIRAGRRCIADGIDGDGRDDNRGAQGGGSGWRRRDRDG
jgi:hypothetical protein